MIAVLSPNISITKNTISHGKTIVNPLLAKIFRANKHIYLHFMSFLHIDMTEVVGILSHVRQELKAPLRLARFSVPRNRQAVRAECHTLPWRYSVAIEAIIARGTARVLLNQGGIGMPYVRNFRPQAHNSAARRGKNWSQSDSCDPRGGIAGWRGSAPR